VAAVVAHAKRLGKVPVVVNDSPGFLVNRILMPYLHEAGQHARVVATDEKAAEIIARYAHPPRESSDRTIVDRLFLPMLLEALRVLDERLVRDAADVDLGVIHALGFPAFRGGLLAWGDSLGAAEVIRRLEPLADLGPRMRPVDRLLAHAASGRPFTE